MIRCHKGMIGFIKRKANLDTQSKTLFKNSFWVLIANIFGFVLGFLRSVVLARGLGVQIFGVYTLVINFASAVLEIFNLNAGTAIIKFGAAYKQENRIDKLVSLVKGCTLASIISFGVAILVITVLLLYSYNSFFNFPGLEWYTVYYAIALAVSMLAMILSSSLLRLFFKFKVNSIVSMIMDAMELLLMWGAIYFYPGNLKIFFLAAIVSKLFNGIVSLIAVIWEIRSELNQYLHAEISLLLEQRKEIRGFVFTNSVSGTLKTFINKGDILLLGALGSPAEIGFYSIAKKLAYSILAITDPLMSAIFPQLSKLVAEKKFSDTITMLKKLTGLLLIPAILCLGFIFSFRTWIITTLFGNEYAPAANSFVVLMVVSLMIAVFFWNLSMIQSLGLINFRFVVYIIALVLGGTASYFLIPVAGATGAAIGLLIAYLIITAAFSGISFKKLFELQRLNK